MADKRECETSFGFDHERTIGSLRWIGTRKDYETFTNDHPIIKIDKSRSLSEYLAILLSSPGYYVFADEKRIRLASRSQLRNLEEQGINFSLEKEIIICPRY
jgi:hypothetical protein